MPARAASLRITDAYRGRMIGLRNRAKSQARKTWSKVRLENLDATFNPGMLILNVSALQKQAAQLSAGYLAAFISSETGQPPKLPVAMALQVNKARTGSSLSKAFRTPLIGVKLQIKDGKDPALALREGGRQLTETVGLAVDEAAREALRIASDQSPEVVGYQRAVKGTCEACMGLADGSTLPAGSELDIHPNCNCVAEPQVQQVFGKTSDLPTRLDVTPRAEVEAAIDRYQSQRGFEQVNAALRGVEEPSALTEATVQGLDDAMASAGSRDAPLKAFRGFKGKLEGAFPELEGKDLIGQIIQEDGFSSTTPARRVAEGFAREEGDLLELTVDKKVKAFRMPDRSIHSITEPAEEVLLDRTLHYRITGIRYERYVQPEEGTIHRRRIIEMLVTNG